MSKLGSAWDRFLFSKWDPLPASLYRITLGVFYLFYLFSNYPNWTRNYSPNGIPCLNDLCFGSPTHQWWSIVYWTTNYVPVEVFWWIGLLAALFLIVGYRTKVATGTIFLIVTGMFHREFWASNAEETMYRMYCFYGLFLPLGECLSVDRWLRDGQAWATEGDPAHSGDRWPARLVQLHLLLIYIFSTPQKWAFDPAWRSGDALYYVMINPTWSRWPWPWMFYNAFISKAATWGSLLLEGSFPFMVWNRRLRNYLVTIMIFFHIFMSIALNYITFFSLSMICGLWLFYSGEDLRRFGEALKTRQILGMAAINRWVYLCLGRKNKSEGVPTSIT